MTAPTVPVQEGGTKSRIGAAGSIANVLHGKQFSPSAAKPMPLKSRPAVIIKVAGMPVSGYSLFLQVDVGGETLGLFGPQFRVR